MTQEELKRADLLVAQAVGALQALGQGTHDWLVADLLRLAEHLRGVAWGPDWERAEQDYAAEDRRP